VIVNSLITILSYFLQKISPFDKQALPYLETMVMSWYYMCVRSKTDPLGSFIFSHVAACACLSVCPWVASSSIHSHTCTARCAVTCPSTLSSQPPPFPVVLPTCHSPSACEPQVSRAVHLWCWASDWIRLGRNGFKCPAVLPDHSLTLAIDPCLREAILKKSSDWYKCIHLYSIIVMIWKYFGSIKGYLQIYFCITIIIKCGSAEWNKM